MVENGAWLASIFGPYMVVIGIWAYFYFNEIGGIWNSIKTNPGLYFLQAILNLIFGFGILSIYREISFHLAFLVTLLGVVCVLKGIIALFFKERWFKWADQIMALPYYRHMMFIPIVWGLLLIILAIWY